jgi:hypothetical protein
MDIKSTGNLDTTKSTLILPMERKKIWTIGGNIRTIGEYLSGAFIVR